MQDSFSHIAGKFNDDDFNLHINVCTSCKKCRPRPGASITIRRWAKVCTLCISRYILMKLAFCEQKKNRSDAKRRAPDHGLHWMQTRVFPIILSIYKQNRLRLGTAWCNTWIVSNQTVQTLIKLPSCGISYANNPIWVSILRVVKQWAK